MLLNVGTVGRIGGVGGIGSGATTDPNAPSLDLVLTGPTLDPRITFTRAAGPATYFDVAGVLQTAGTNVARFDYNPVTHAARGLLIEEARTNNVRNNTMAGAVVGSPGTLPTNWTTQGPTGPTRTISLGTMNGISYIDINHTGTLTSTSQFIFTFDVATGSATPAASGQTWSESCYVTLIQGDPAVTSVFGSIRATDGTTQTEVSTSSSILGLLSASAWYRVAHAFTLANAGTTNITSRIVTNSVASGATINFTIRIGMPQLELGAFATSAIPTSTVAVTRPVDAATMPVGAWFNAAASTIAADYIIGQSPNPGTSNRDVLALSDGAVTNRMVLRSVSLGVNTTAFLSAISGVTLNSAPLGVVTPNVTSRIAASWNGTTAIGSLNGGAAVSYASGMPAGLNALTFGNQFVGATVPMSGWISRARYWPRALSAAELQSNTA